MYKPGDTLKGLGQQGGQGQRYEVPSSRGCCMQTWAGCQQSTVAGIRLSSTHSASCHAHHRGSLAKSKSDFDMSSRL